MHVQFGMHYILGLPLLPGNTNFTQSVKEAFDTAIQSYPQAIISYELGNEPNFWPWKEGGYAMEPSAVEIKLQSSQQLHPRDLEKGPVGREGLLQS